MRITSTAMKSCKFLQSLKPLNPNSQSRNLHLSTEKPSLNPRINLKHSKEQHQQHKQSSLAAASSSSSPTTLTSIIDILKSNSKDAWKSNDQLTSAIPSLSSENFLQIARHLGSSSIALHFVEHLRENSKCPDEKSLSFVFQGALELASREDGHGDKLLELYSKAKELNVSLSVNSVTHLIRCFSRAKLIDQSVMVYEELDAQMKKNVHVRNLMIQVLLRSEICRLEYAAQLLDEMLQPDFEFPVDETTRSTVFQAMYSCGMWGSEEKFLKMVSSFGSRGLLPGAIRLTKWIGELCQQRRVNTAWELLHAVMKLGSPEPVTMCNAMLTSLQAVGEFDKMNLLMKEMQEKGICPDVVTLGISINHLCKAMRLDEALELFEKMKRGEIRAGLEPDVVIYNTLIDGLCKSGRIEDGLVMMRRMVSEGGWPTTTRTYNCLIDGFCKAGEMDRSLELFDEMNKERVNPDIITVNALIGGFCMYGKSGSALKFYRQMQEKGLDGNKRTYTILINGFCGVNNIRKAMELLDEMKEKCKPDAIVYYTLISGLSQAGLMNEVESVVSEMKTAGFCPDIGCYNVMINGYCQKNKVEKAHQLVKQMVENGVKPDSITYNTLISYFSRIGDRITSHALLEQMLKDKVAPTIVTYGTLINACCSVGEQDEALRILREINLSTRVSANTVIYNTLIDSLCRSKRVKIALSLFNEMLDRDVRPNTNTFNALFKVLREENKLGKTFELMDKMIILKCSPDYITLEVLADWLPAVGANEKLKAFVEHFAISV